MASVASEREMKNERVKEEEKKGNSRGVKVPRGAQISYVLIMQRFLHKKKSWSHTLAPQFAPFGDFAYLHFHENLIWSLCKRGDFFFLEKYFKLNELINIDYEVW